MNWRTKVLATLACFLCLFYVVWLITAVTGPLGWVLLVCEWCIASLSFIFIACHWEQDHTLASQHKPQGTLDVFIPVVNEPLDMLEKTVSAAAKITYPKKIYVLDDGHRDDVKELVRAHKAIYLSRPTQEHYKAGNLNYGLQHSTGDYVLVLDADQIVKSTIARELLGHFQDDPQLAFVTTRQKFSTPKSDFNHDTIFYEHMQPGKNGDNSAISCGSGVIYCRNKLAAIGGFQTWSIVEDLYTSYMLHRAGFTTLYVNKAYTVGTAPINLKDIYKQRGIWAYDTLRVFFRQSPLFVKGLTFMQRLHYVEISWAYIVSAVILPILYLLPAIGLLTNQPVIRNETLYYMFRLPSLAAQLLLYYLVSGRSFATTRYWGSLCFLYFRSLIWSLFPGKRKYTVTSKSQKLTANVWLILPHIGYIIINVIAIVCRVFLWQHFAIETQTID